MHSDYRQDDPSVAAPAVAHVGGALFRRRMIEEALNNGDELTSYEQATSSAAVALDSPWESRHSQPQQHSIFAGLQHPHLNRLPPGFFHSGLVVRMPPGAFEEVIEMMKSLSVGSWERGVACQALLELYNPELTPFTPHKHIKFPNPSNKSHTYFAVDDDASSRSSPSKTPAKLVATPPIPASIRRASDWVKDHHPTSSTYPYGQGKALLEDDSTSDPLSLGMPCLLRGMYEGEPKAERGGEWRSMVDRAVEWLEEVVLKTDDGCWSHRTHELGLWADFVCMAPPFFAYYALLQPAEIERKRYFRLAYDQCRLYRDHLIMPESAPSERTESAARPQEEPVGSEKDSVTTKRPETRGRLWKHIVGVDAKAKRGKVDPFAWSTSNAWAAAGMLRVLATFMRAPAPPTTPSPHHAHGQIPLHSDLAAAPSASTASDMNIDGGATTSHQDQSEEAPGVEDTDETEEDNPVPVPVPVEIGTDMADECQDLLDWICEIMDAVVVNVAPSGLVRNYINVPDFPEETCGTALFASVAYRLSYLGLTDAYLDFAHQAQSVVMSHIDPTTGLLSQVTAIDDERQLRKTSAEGQSFVVLMEAARSAWWEQMRDAEGQMTTAIRSRQ